jgi:hypothetical protein
MDQEGGEDGMEKNFWIRKKKSFEKDSSEKGKEK